MRGGSDGIWRVHYLTSRAGDAIKMLTSDQPPSPDRSSPAPDWLMPIIYGPTASGKSQLALAIVAELTTRGIQSEIVTADAFQIYRGMDIGTAKPSPEERARVRHHLIDICSPFVSALGDQPAGASIGPREGIGGFTVENWLAMAEPCIADIRARGAVPVVVGGTSLYVQSLLFGLFRGPSSDESLRLLLQATPIAELRAELERVDPAGAARIHPADVRRTIRAVEVFRLSGKPITEHQQQWEGRPPRADARLLVLEWDKDALARRINARVKGMFATEHGLVTEIAGLLSQGTLNWQAAEAIGYKQVLPLFDDPATGTLRTDEHGRVLIPGGQRGVRLMEEAAEHVKIATRRLAKNQRTWLTRLSQTPGTLLLDGQLPPQELARLACDAVITPPPEGR